MNTRLSSPKLPRAAAGWFAPGAVVVAVAAAMTLAACGPRDETPIAGGSPAVSSPVDPALRQAGQPVPPTSTQVALAPAPADVPPVQTTTVPTPVPAQPSPVVMPPTMVAAGPGSAAYPVDPAPAPQSRPAPAPVAPPVASNRVGSITSIEPIRTRPKGSGAGAVIGGVLGAVVGN